LILLKIEPVSERESRRRLCHTFNSIISLENLLTSWQEFIKGKRDRKDVCEFSVCLMDNIFSLRADLLRKTYRHGQYQAFKINDPKPRQIHKAQVRDRLLHHAIYRILYPYFDRKFIYDSYSCRDGKGTHRAINRFRNFAGKVSRNNTKTAWILKCDIKKFFANIDHRILIEILKRHIGNADTIWLLEQVIESFNTESRAEVGLPLGNLTSQLFINIYMNEFDQFAKRELKLRYYIRYADDFVILHENKTYLKDLIPKMSEYLRKQLKLYLHPKKVFIKTLSSGIDFLGWINFPYYRILRTATKRRMLRNLEQNNSKEARASYLGLLKHGNTYKLMERIK